MAPRSLCASTRHLSEQRSGDPGSPTPGAARRVLAVHPEDAVLVAVKGDRPAGRIQVIASLGSGRTPTLRQRTAVASTGSWRQ